MSEQYDPQDLRYPIILDRPEYCPQERHMTRHQFTVYPDREYHRCKECGHVKEFIYDPDLLSTNQADVRRQEIEKVLYTLTTLASHIANHRWSKNLGQKDQEEVTYIRTSLTSTIRRLQELLETPKEV